MVETFRNEWTQCVFAGVTARAVATVVTKCDGLSKYNVESECARYSGCNLSNFESMGEASALMILWEDEYLCFAGESAECRSVQNAIAVALETGAEWVFLFGYYTIAGTK
jgi:hypothetical protein